MIKAHRDLIQTNFLSLVDRTDLNAVVNLLYEKGVFSEQMIEPYKNERESERDRKRKLFIDVPKRGPEAFRHLVDTLSELGYWDLVRDLDPNSPYSLSTHRPYQPLPRPTPSNSGDDNFHSLSEKNKHKNERNTVGRISQYHNVSGSGNIAGVRAASPQPVVTLNDEAGGDADTLPHFTVIKSTKFMEEGNAKDVKLYKTRGRNRGVFLDFTYIKFDNDIETYRSGVQADRANLKYLFTELGFRVINLPPDLTKADTIMTLKELKLEGLESVFVAVSSHGYERANSSDNDIRCSDGKLISLYEIIAYFNNKNMPGLIGVPKVFIFQMCRGSNSEFAWRPTAEMTMPAGETDAGRAESEEGGGRGGAGGARHAARSPRAKPPPHTPLYSDILIAHSTLPGQVAYRDGKLGSWYIQTLCEVFATRAHDVHVEKLFTLVDENMRDRYHIQTTSVDRWGFNKRLYLHPGLYDA